MQVALRQNWPVPQRFPHAPQFAASVVRSTQTPLHRIWLGLGQLGITQTPPVHCSPRAHGLLQAPQLRVSMEVLVQVPLQFVWPGNGHGIGAHIPPRHWALEAHRLPHAPQFRLSLEVSMQKPKHV